MNDRNQRKIERIQKNIQETEALLDEWEEQKRLASNPTERKRCDLEIARLQKIIKDHENELLALDSSETSPIDTPDDQVLDPEQLQIKVEQFILKNQLRQALLLIAHFYNDLENAEMKNWANAQLGRLSSFENDYHSGVLTYEQHTTEQNKIRQAIFRKLGKE
ncbi:MAG: hypothetical protein NW226_05140 [Microscillaceae bacterium]|nr:hypothetical protein [Microscillaceae bacterium]